MSESRNLLSGKRKYLYGLILLSFISVICVDFSMTGNDDFDFARREILLRRIGHEILLQSGDSTSRVVPVEKIAENEYQISFENATSNEKHGSGFGILHKKFSDWYRMAGIY